jgi:hypothetical protein
MPHAGIDEAPNASIQAEFSRSAEQRALNVVPVPAHVQALSGASSLWGVLFRTAPDGRVVAAFPSGVEIVFACGPRELAQRLLALADSQAETIPAPPEAT